VDWVVVLYEVGVIAVLLLAQLRGAAITHYIVYYVPALSDMRRDESLIVYCVGLSTLSVFSDRGYKLSDSDWGCRAASSR
jgi:hypothetical protein